jgi:hypothetical protein
MPRLTLSMPTELGRGSVQEDAARRGRYGTSDSTERRRDVESSDSAVMRWFACWAGPAES